MSQGLPGKLQGMLAELEGIEDLTEKYQVLIEMGEELSDIPAAMKTPEHMVQGCLSLVHVYGELDSAGKLDFHGYADAKIVNGLLALLVLGLSGLSPEEFVGISPDFIKSTGVSQTLTPSRINGFYNIFEKMKLEALRFLGKNETGKRFPAN